VIERTIHRLWLGPRPMPARFREYGAAWAALNPGWTVHDWSWHDLPDDLANQDVMDDLRTRCTSGNSIELPTQLADIIDYDLIYRFGGIYLNADIQPVRPLVPEMTDGRCWATREDDHTPYAVNAAMGGPAGHPFWKAVVEELPRRYWHLRGQGYQEMNQLTGPHLLTDAANNVPGLHVFPHTAFNPVHWSRIAPGTTADGTWSAGTLPPDTVGVHHWHHREARRTNIVH
jgi:inositol phosphorylceramide mannosyltransferase catalytic subunit